MLRVSPTGSKAWYVQLDRKRKRKIGDASVLTATMARYRARDLLQRADHLKSTAKGSDAMALGAFLQGRYSDWIDRNSRYGKRDTMRLVSALGPLAAERVDHLGVSQIERWKLKRGKTVVAATLNRELAALKAALNCALRWKVISDNPASRVSPLKTGRQTALRLLEDDERIRLLNGLAGRENQISVMALTALHTGLSRSELFSLRWKDVFFGTNSYLETRSGRRRRNRSRKIPLNPTAFSALKKWKINRKNRSTLVFPSPSGGQLKSISTSWKRLMNELEIPNFRLSDCRHDFAIRLVRKGAPITQVSALMGHSSLTLASRYADFAPGTARDSVNKLETQAAGQGNQISQGRPDTRL